MPDAIQIVKPGFRVTDADVNPVSGAIIKFFDAGTDTPRTVYSDDDLSVSLGTTVTCSSAGVPTSDGSTTVEVYTGNTPYKVEFYTSGDVLIPGLSFDNVIGALDTSSFVTDAAIVPSTPITNSSSNQTPANADKGKYYNVDSSGADVTYTIANPALLDNGWFIKVRKDDAGNQILFTTTSGTALFNIPGHAGVTHFAQTEFGQVYTITCDQTGFNVEETSPALTAAVGRLLITDRLSAPPGSPQAGARYILTSSPSGDWSSFAEHDIAEADGNGGWFKYTPAADSGYRAYVIDEDTNYYFRGSAWASEDSSTTQKGRIEQAVQAEMEAKTAGFAVTPDVQHHHILHPKYVLNYNQITPAIVFDDGVASVSDDSAGDFTVTADTAFSDTTYAAMGSSYDVDGTAVRIQTGSNVAYTTTQRSFKCTNTAATDTDDGNIVVAFGDH